MKIAVIVLLAAALAYALMMLIAALLGPGAPPALRKALGSPDLSADKLRRKMILIALFTLILLVPIVARFF